MLPYIRTYSDEIDNQWVDSDVEGSPAMWLEQFNRIPRVFECFVFQHLRSFSHNSYIHGFLVYNSLIATVDDISMISQYAWPNFQHAAGASGPGNWVRAQLVPPLSAGAKNLLVKVGWVVRRTCFEF
jgi:hypothetical protein